MKLWSQLLLLPMLLSACDRTGASGVIRQDHPSRKLAIVFAGDRDGVNIFPEKIYIENERNERTFFKPSDIESVRQSAFSIAPAWSPDWEWLILPNGRFEGFVVFKAKDLPESLESKSKSMRIGVLGLEGSKWWHEFVRWRSPSVFEFRAGLSGDLLLFNCDLKSGKVTLAGDTQAAFTQIPK